MTYPRRIKRRKVHERMMDKLIQKNLSKQRKHSFRILQFLAESCNIINNCNEEFIERILYYFTETYT